MANPPSRVIGQLLNQALSTLGLEVVKKSTIERLRLGEVALTLIEILRWSEAERRAHLLDLFPHSKSQLLQDLFVLATVGFKEGGSFVEFGATNGVSLSNTYLLEKRFNWKGILSEPGRRWQESLKKNRPGSSVDFRCVWSTTGEAMTFLEANEGELSTISDFANEDDQGKLRRRGRRYSVESVSLEDLLKQHDAPTEIDYLSIDTEGSELAILEAFDFSAYSFRVITCEHNYTAQREAIRLLLNSFGYKRVLEVASRWDDWYVHESSWPATAS